MDLESLTTLILQYKYPILIPASFLAGQPAAMITGFLIRLGTLEFLPAYICLMLGELFGDIMWYWVGHHWGERFVGRFGRFFGVTVREVDIVRHLFQKYHQGILFFSKLTSGMGFAIPLLFTAGMVRVPFWRYMWANVSGQLFWTAGLISVGFFFGHLYIQFNGVLEKITIISFFLIFIGLMFGFGKYLHGRIEKKYKSE